MASKLELLPQDIAKRLQRLPEALLSQEGWAALWLFGSFARGDATPISDVDLAFLPEPSRLEDEEAIARLEGQLHRAVASTLRTDEFTLVNLKRAPGHLAHRVLVEGRLLACRDVRTVAEFAEAVYRRAPDVRWLRHRCNLDFLEGMGVETNGPSSRSSKTG